MYTIYAIKSQVRNYIYVGMTTDLMRRLAEHQNGYNKTTRPYKPFVLIYKKENIIDRVHARKRERYIKSGVGKEFLKRI